MAGGQSQAQVHTVLLPVVEEAGYDLEAVELTPAGNRRVLRVVVDRDGGVDLDAVAELTRLVGAALDDSDVLGASAYLLEVTTPGVARPLTEPRHWRRAASRLVEVVALGEPVRARVLGADDAAVRLEVAGEERVIPYADLGPGHVQVEFGRVRDAGETA